MSIWDNENIYMQGLEKRIAGTKDLNKRTQLMDFYLKEMNRESL